MFVCTIVSRQNVFCVTLLCLLTISNKLVFALHISGVSQRTVGLAGGAKVTIYGSGFSEDQYGGANRVYIGNVICDVDWYNSASQHRVVCLTRPWPDSVEGECTDYLPVQVYVGRLSFTRNLIRYCWGRTPRIDGVVPRSFVVKTVVELKGWFVSGDARKIERVMVGNDVCDMFRPDSSELYRNNELDSNTLKCQAASRKVGFHNAVILLPEYGGSSWNRSLALQPGPSGQLYMYEIHADVTNVYPNLGSSNGGTLLRISGSGFGTNAKQISVDVGGVPCTIVGKVKNDLITCVTGSPSPDSPVIQTTNGSFELSNGTFFEGARGATMKVWHDIDGTLLSNLIASDNYPHYPDVIYNVDAFSSPWLYGDRYGVEVEAVFTADQDSWHTFYIASDDNGELWFANTTNALEAQRIAFVPGWTGLTDYWKFTEQRSAPINLTKGQKCYLKARAKEHGGGDFVKVAVLVHTPSFKYTRKETKAAVAEHQQVVTRATVHNEIQAITMTYSLSSSHLNSAFQFVWGNRQSPQLSVDATNEDVRQAILDLFEAKCDTFSLDDDTYDIDSFEQEGEHWNVLSGKTRPNIVYGDAYCGRRFLEVVSGYAQNFNGDSGLEGFQDELGYLTADYPYVCMAYRIPRGTHAALAVNIVDHGWRSVPVTDFTEGLPFPYLSNWVTEDGSQIQDDNQWHYSCFNLDSALANVYGNSELYVVLGIGFASPQPRYRNGPFFVDEFSISSRVRGIQQVDASAQPNGLMLADVFVSNTTYIQNNSVAITFELEYEATSCFDNYSLIEVTTSGQLDVSSHVIRNASDAIEGTFNLSMFGHWTPEIPHDANSEELKLALETIPEVGEVTVYEWNLDVKRKCGVRGWNVYFFDIPNDLPLMKINSSLEGQDVHAFVKEYSPGGILFDPIPGYMLRTVERTPQVHVVVKNVSASCQGSGESVHATRFSENTSCQFAYSHNVQPVVLSLSPDSGYAGDVVTITGLRFVTNVEEYDIRFGSVSCYVQDATGTEVQCVVGDNYAGEHELYFQIYSSGIANTTAFSFQYYLNFSLIEPSAGSVGGGLVAILEGSGFLPFRNENSSCPQQTVLFDDQPCIVVSSNSTQLQCIIPEADSTGFVNVTAVVTSVDCKQTSYTLDDAFLYSDALTPYVASIDPSEGSAGGGTVVIIMGSGFANTVTGNTVKIGSVVCKVLSATNDTIECETNSSKPGTYDVVVFVAGSGNSVMKVNFTYVLRIDNLSHFAGSIVGGQRIQVTGAGFGTNSSLVDVLLGDKSCNVEIVNNEVIQCVTRSSSTTHRVDNLGRNSQYGVGYQWRPQHIRIQEGDNVEWEWFGSSYTTMRSVVQVKDEEAIDYDGVGFRSKASVSGHFSFTFDEPGVYYYVSDGHADIGFRGSVNVTQLRTKRVPISVLVNNITASHTDSLLNNSLNAMMVSCDNDTDIPDNYSNVAYYSYSHCKTPIITDVQPSVVTVVDEIVVFGNTFADTPYAEFLNTLTIGGKACQKSNSSRLSDSLSSNVTTLSDRQIGLRDELNCFVPERPPGLYRVVVHVAGRGWGFGSLQATSLEYRPAFSMNVTSGSVYGGTKVILFGVGFHPKASRGNVVQIGNTVCDVQALTESNDDGEESSLVCITRQRFQDGYSQVVNESNPLGYWRLNDRGMMQWNNKALLVAKNLGWIGANGNGMFWGHIETGVDGISGDKWTNSAVKFNGGWVAVPYLLTLNSPSILSGELWLKHLPTNGSYQLVLGAFNGDLASRGYALWINPCGELEFWLAASTPNIDQTSSCHDPFTNYSSNTTEESASGASGISSVNGGSGAGGTSSANGGSGAGGTSTANGGSGAGGTSSANGGSGAGGTSSANGGSGASGTSGGSGASGVFYNVCGVCNGIRIVSLDESEQTGLPAGVWSVITSEKLRNSWVYIVFSWKLDENLSVHKSGVQTLYVDTEIVENRTTTFSHNVRSSLLIGGQSISSRSNGSLTPFHGVVAEVALYGALLSEGAIMRHYYYGNSKKQPVSLRYEKEDHRGKGAVPNVQYSLAPVDYSDVMVNWSVVNNGTMHVETSDRLQFEWNGFHSVVEVSRREFDSCTSNGKEKRIVWGLSQSKGVATVVGLEPGRNHYFISDVTGDCEKGHKMQVFVGSEVVIEWRLGRVYNHVSIAYGTGIRFQWSGGLGVYHDVVELASKDAYEECAVSQVAQMSGSVIARYSQPVTIGNVPVNGLRVGTHYFACAVSGHCVAGMHLMVTVTGENDVKDYDSSNQLYQSVHVHWRIVSYSDVVITQGDVVVFEWDEFHSLSQVTKTAYDDCDLSSTMALKEWSRPSVTGTVKVSGLAPGTYYFICAVGGNCGAGMKVALIVKSRSDLPVFNLEKAKCLTGYCSYEFKKEQTPVLVSIEPDHGRPGTVLSVVGSQLLSEDFGQTSKLSSVLEVRIGNSLCMNAEQVSYQSDNQTISCVVDDQEAGNKKVTVLVYGNGLSQSVVNIHNSIGKLIFHVDAFVMNVSPNNGSIAGGTLITLTGSGLSYVKSNVTIMIGNYECEVQDSSFISVTCLTSSVETAKDHHNRPFPVVVFIGNYNVSSSVFYTYSTNSTPVIFNVSSSILVASNVIAISGIFFSSQTDNVEVYIMRRAYHFGLLPNQLATTSQDCAVQSATDTEIDCVVGARVAGDRYIVAVKISNVGYAVYQPDHAADVRYELQIDSVTPTSFGLGGGVEVAVTGVGFLSGTVENEESGFHFKSEYSYADTQKAAAAAGQTLAASNLHGKLVSSHGVNYGVTYSITVCSQICNILASTYNKTVCIVPQYQLLANIKNDTDINDMLALVHSCPVEAFVNGSSGESHAMFAFNVTYDGSLTPIIDNVFPRRGGTAGGTLLTIIGSGFNSTVNGETVVVSIDGIECSLREFNNSHIKCRTEAHTTTLNSRVSVVVPGKGSAVELFLGNATSPSSAQFEYIDRWSSRFTWGGNNPPEEGAAVYIQDGQTVLLDTSTPVLGLLVIVGNLIFDDNQDIHLQAKYIFINGGRLQVGTEEEPFMHRATITLHGNVRDPELPMYGAKVLGLRRGSLELHGRPRSITWTRLAETVKKNETVLELMEPVDWLEDDLVVIASTSKDGNETETGRISVVENGGYRIVLHNPVKSTHYGIRDVLEDGQFIDIRAEVGLLSHNVIVQGSQYAGDSLDDLGADQYGSQIMVHRAGEDPTPVHMEHVEVRHAGQAFRLGRYAVHFHLSDKMNGSYVRHCSIHHSHNRAITAHGVHEMLFEGVVAYDIMGHTFFVEDGIETGNQYIRNLGLVTRGSSSLLNTDQLPATFWITNPNNTFIGNAAAGSRAYGFWYDLDPFPVGPSFTTSVCPNKTPFGEFRDNVAHTNAEFGLRIWETYTPKENGCTGDDVPANLYNFVSYSNGIHGLELSVVGHVRLIGFKVADNRDDGIAIQEGHGQWGGPMVKDTLIISHTIANQGSPQKGGIRTPNRRLFTFSNITFARFDDPSLSCLRACSHCKKFQGGFQYWFEKINYLGNSSLHRAAFQWEHEVLFKDLDGTLAGVPGGWVTPANGLLPLEYCRQLPEYSLNAKFPGSVCTANVSLLRLAWNNAEPIATFKGRDVLVSTENGSSVIPWRHKRLTHGDGYMLTLSSQQVYNVTYDVPPSISVDNTAYEAGLYDVPIGESIIIKTSFDTAPNHFKIGLNRQDIGREVEFSDNHTSWHFDNETLELQYILSAKEKTESLNDLLYSFSKEPCPVRGCAAPNDKVDYESNWRKWSVANDWPKKRVPGSGANVTIESSWRMYVDVSEVNVEKIEIQGHLEFDNKRDVVFNATWIVIIGSNGKLVVGEKGKPFTYKATIFLKGNRKVPNLVYSRNVIVGSKAIGVFGELHLNGEQRDVMWTELSQSAVAGDSQLHLNTLVNWKAGDELVVSPSGYLPSEAEVVTVRSVSNNVVTLQQSLQFDHVVDHFLSGNETGTGNNASRWWHANNGVRMASKVGILTQNVQIIGEEDIYNSISVDEFGCRILVGSYQYRLADHTGKAFIDSVQFKYCGQGGFFSQRDPRYVVAFKNALDGSAGSYIKHSSVHTAFNTAFGTLASNSIEFSDNVVYHSVDSMFKVSSLNCTVKGNLAVFTRSIQLARPKDKFAVDFPATFNIRGTGHVVKDNVASGSERVGFYFPGEQCIDDAAPRKADAQFWGNSAQTGLIGLVITGLRESCSAAGGFKASRQWEYGVFSSTASRIALREVMVAVGHTGLCLNIFGPDPVKHQLDYKWIKVEDSLLVGSTAKEPCFTSTPSHCPSISTGAHDPKLGIMMASFVKKRSKMNGFVPWHKPMSYPTIAGQVNITSVTFARFNNFPPCQHGSYVIANNKLSPDAMHPVYFKDTGLLDVAGDRTARLYPPNPKWIVQEDCVDMDCDGPKHSIINDVDGKLVQTTGERGSIIPRAEIRFDQSRLPETMRYSGESSKTRLDPNSLIDKRGIARGDNTTFNSAIPGCVWVSSWNAYKCSGLDHQMLVIESMDSDSEVRRVSPIALHGGNTGNGTYMDLMNGPMDHGWCTYYTCLKRLSTFFSIVAIGTDYQLWFTGSNPGHLRFHLLNTYGGPSDAPGQGVRLSIWYKNPQRKDVYKSGVYLEPENAIFQPNGKSRRPDGDKYIPQITRHHSGANYFDRARKTLHLIIKGSEPVEVTTPPVAQVSLSLALDSDSVFNADDFVNKLAFLLGIPDSMITIVDVIAEDSSLSGRRRRGLLTQAPMSLQVDIEIGNPPAPNISQPEMSSIDEQTDEGGGGDTDPVTVDSDNVTASTVAPQVATDNANITADGQSIPTDDELQSDYIQSAQQFLKDSAAYAESVKEVNIVNLLVEDLINKIQTGQLDIENATVSNVTVAPALPLPEPVIPAVPPGLENLTTSSGEKLFPTIDVEPPPPLLFDEQNNGSQLQFQIPTAAFVSREPPAISSHLVYVSVVIEDASGNPVENLGLSASWHCNASLIYNIDDLDPPRLEGITSVTFQRGGYAEFTRLRVDKAANGLQLEFHVSPGGFTARTQTLFSVVSPTLSSTAHKFVEFVIQESFQLVIDGPGGVEGFRQALRNELSRALDLDVARILVDLKEGSIICSVAILEKASTDPDDVPSLQATVSYLGNLIKAGQLTITFGLHELAVDQSSFMVIQDQDTENKEDSIGFPTWAIIVIAVPVGFTVVALIILWVKLRNSSGKSRSQKKVHPDNRCADSPKRSCPTVMSSASCANVDFDMARDSFELSEFGYHNTVAIDYSLKETRWGTAQYDSVPEYDRGLTPVENTNELGSRKMP